MALLEVENLTVSFPTPDGLVEAVRSLSFSVEAGKTLGIVGESGSGKSLSVQTIVGLTRGARSRGARSSNPPNSSERRAELQAVRGAKIGMIFQDPLSALHPFYKVGWQIAEMIHAHKKDVSRKQAHAQAIDLLALVGIPQPERRADEFSHQFSGGMRQRAMIAMALALHPALLIADEPTTALDVTVQAQIIDLMRHLQDEFGIAIIMITHDLGVIAGMADEVLVMYAGSAMEVSGRRSLYYRPHHPYTAGLLSSLPQLGKEGEPLAPIAGQPPSLIDPPSGCPFHPRCAYVMQRCSQEAPPLIAVEGPEHRSACFLDPTLLGVGAEIDVARHEYADSHGALHANVDSTSPAATS